MKASIKNIVSAYTILGKAKVTKLEESEVIKVLDARMAMRPICEDFEAFAKDADEKFRYEGIEDDDKVRAEFVKKWNADHSYQPTETEVEAINRINAFFKSVASAKAEKEMREVEITIDPLKKESFAKLLIENGFEPSELDGLKALM